MNAAAGTSDRSAPRSSRTLTPGKVLVAPRKRRRSGIRWSDIAKAFRAGDVQARQQLLATHLTNPNSTRFLTNLAARSSTLETSTLATELRLGTPAVDLGREQCWAPSRCGATVPVAEPRLRTSDLVSVAAGGRAPSTRVSSTRLKDPRPARWRTSPAIA